VVSATVISVVTPLLAAVVPRTVLALPPAVMPAVMAIAPVFVMLSMMTSVAVPAPVLRGVDCPVQLTLGSPQERRRVRPGHEGKTAGVALRRDQGSQSPQCDCA
jgi:hypothetical protein